MTRVRYAGDEKTSLTAGLARDAAPDRTAWMPCSCCWGDMAGAAMLLTRAFGGRRGGKLGGRADCRAAPGAAGFLRGWWRRVGEAGAPRDQAARDHPARRRRPAAARPARGH